MSGFIFDLSVSSVLYCEFDSMSGMFVYLYLNFVLVMLLTGTALLGDCLVFFLSYM